MELKTRDEKIKFLRDYAAGKIKLSDLEPLPIMGMVLKEGDNYHLSDGTILSESEFNAYRSKWANAPDDGTIYGMIII